MVELGCTKLHCTHDQYLSLKLRYTVTLKQLLVCHPLPWSMFQPGTMHLRGKSDVQRYSHVVRSLRVGQLRLSRYKSYRQLFCFVYDNVNFDSLLVTKLAITESSPFSFAYIKVSHQHTHSLLLCIPLLVTCKVTKRSMHILLMYNNNIMMSFFSQNEVRKVYGVLVTDDENFRGWDTTPG